MLLPTPLYSCTAPQFSPVPNTTVLSHAIQLTTAMMATQEQLWSDKIRRAATWWTWGLMGLHFGSFLVVYAVLEPRKRAALTAAVSDMLATHAESLDTRLASLGMADVSYTHLTLPTNREVEK